MNEKLKQFAQAAMSMATGKSMTPSGTKYFANGRKGENFELKADLNSDRPSRQKEALKRIIANMTIGKDVSYLFADVIKCIQTVDIALKKLVYLYLMNYATSQPELALLAINTFCKDTEDKNPMIRALAIRTMSCIRIEKMVDYLCEPLSRSLRDPHPYVRKTAALAIAKLNELSPNLVYDNGFHDRLLETLQDPSPTVVANAVAALLEIHRFNYAFSNGNHKMPLSSVHLTRVLLALNDCTEWGQANLLQILSYVQPAESFEAESILEKVAPRLQHTNPAVVLAAIKVIMIQLPHATRMDAAYKDNMRKKMIPPLISLVTHPTEQVQFTVLRQVYLILQEFPELLTTVLPIFFCKYNDPLYNKIEKLRIMVLMANSQNIDVLLDEFKGYCKEVDLVFVEQSIQCLGQLALKIPSSVSRVLYMLLGHIETHIPYLVQPSLIVLRDLIRSGHRDLVQSCLHKVLDQAILQVTREPEPKATLIWLFGEYSHLVDAAPQWLSYFCDEVFFTAEATPIVQYEILTASLKIYLRIPDIVHTTVSEFLKRASESLENIDLRDRVILYWRFLSSYPEKARQLLLQSHPLSRITTQLTYPSEILQALLADLTSLAALYHTPRDWMPKAPVIRPLSDVALHERQAMAILSTGGAESQTATQTQISSQPILDLLDYDDDVNILQQSFSNQMTFESSTWNNTSVPRKTENPSAPLELKPTTQNLPKNSPLIDLLGDDFNDAFTTSK